MASKLKQIWQSGDVAINGWPAISNRFSAELMAVAGWDGLTVDLQHGGLGVICR